MKRRSAPRVDEPPAIGEIDTSGHFIDSSWSILRRYSALVKTVRTLMNKLFPLLLAVALAPLSGCMTASVIDSARNGPHYRQVVDPKTEETALCRSYPWANYLLVPLTVPADIVTSPIQALGIIFWLAMGVRC
jgi:hypothetical protein